MYLPPSKEWLAKRKIGKDSWKYSCRKAPAIGRFFEGTAARILDADPTDVRRPIGDLLIPGKTGTYVLAEVKSAGISNIGFRTPSKQYDLICNEIGFHIERAVYVCFQWRNIQWHKPTGRNVSVLTRCKGASECANVIITRTEKLYLIDPELIGAIRRTTGTRKGLLADPNEECILVTRATLSDIQKDFAGTLGHFGLKQQGWAMEKRSISVPFVRHDPRELGLDELDLRMNIDVLEIRQRKYPPISARIADKIDPIKIRDGKIVTDEVEHIQQELPL